MQHAADQRERDRAEPALTVAMADADAIVAQFNDRWGAEVDTRVMVALGIGSVDQPLFTFVLLLPLPQDFDPDDWPSEMIDRLDDELRAAVVDSSVDDWDWLITARAVAET